MKFDLTSSQYEFILKEVLQPIRVEGGSLWCFGSRARGDNNEFSDLDLMVETASGAESLRPLIGSIKEKVVNSNFPFKVDLVLLNDFAESYRTQYHQEKIEFTSLKNKFK